MSNTLQFDHDYDLFSGFAINYQNVESPRSMPCAHYHDDYEMYFLIDGNRKYFLSNKIYTIQPNQIILITPKEPHQVVLNMQIPYKRYVVYITPKLLSAICRENPSLNCKYKTQVFDLPKEHFERIVELLVECNAEFEKRDGYSPDIIKSHLVEMLALIKRHYNSACAHTATKSDLRLQESIDHIVNNYYEPITLEKCAEIAHLSPNYFSSVFSRATGLSFKEFLNKIRIDKACELLENTSLSIAEISQNVGFSTQSYFGYVFKAMKNCSTSEYRKQHNKNRKKADEA